MVVCPLDLIQKFIHSFSLRHKDRGSDQTLELLFFICYADKVFCINDSADLINGSAIDRNPAVSAFDNQFFRICDGGSHGKCRDIHAGSHDLFYRGVRQVKNSFDHSLFSFFQITVRLIFHHVKNFIFQTCLIFRICFIQKLFHPPVNQLVKGDQREKDRFR